jgi:hypothetical protein
VFHRQNVQLHLVTGSCTRVFPSRSSKSGDLTFIVCSSVRRAQGVRVKKIELKMGALMGALVSALECAAEMSASNECCCALMGPLIQSSAGDPDEGGTKGKYR